VNHDGKFKSIPKTESVFSINLEGAVALLAAANGPAPLADLGEHPSGEGRIEVFSGRFGPYVQHNGIRATLPKSVTPEELTVEQALELLVEKAAKDGGKTGKKPAAKKPAAKKVAAPKAVATKTATTKTTVKKTATKKASSSKAATSKRTKKTAEE
jgi:DNA topoisomerase I